MTTTKTGGPAYPSEHETGCFVHGENGQPVPEIKRSEGMTLLDRYAIAAMQSMLSKTVFSIAEDEHEQLAWASYEIAGEMLLARERYINGEDIQ